MRWLAVAGSKVEEGCRWWASGWPFVGKASRHWCGISVEVVGVQVAMEMETILGKMDLQWMWPAMQWWFGLASSEKKGWLLGSLGRVGCCDDGEEAVALCVGCSVLEEEVVRGAAVVLEEEDGQRMWWLLGCFLIGAVRVQRIRSFQPPPRVIIKKWFYVVCNDM